MSEELVVEGDGEYVDIAYPGFSPIAEGVPRKEAVLMVNAFNASRRPVTEAAPGGLSESEIRAAIVGLIQNGQTRQAIERAIDVLRRLLTPAPNRDADLLGKWLRRWPPCSREGLCREKWEGPSFQDDCFACDQRQHLEREVAALAQAEMKGSAGQESPK